MLKNVFYLCTERHAASVFVSGKTTHFLFRRLQTRLLAQKKTQSVVAGR